MSNQLREVALDAELTLSDGTPVRLALPGPSAPKKRARWPWVIVATLAGYGAWFSQQPWLFVDGPNVVANTVPGMDKVLCQRMIEDLQPSLDGQQSWLPPLDNVRLTSRCLNDRLQLETLTAQALIFAGLPIERLRLDAIQTPEGWELQSRLSGLIKTDQHDPASPLQLIEPLRQVSLDVLDPLIAAQRHILRGEFEQALSALSTREGQTADLTRARALRLLGRLEQAWPLYERHSESSGLAQLALAEIAASQGQTTQAITLMRSALQAPPELRIALALQLEQYEIADQWLSAFGRERAPELTAHLLHARGQFGQSINAYAKVPASQLSADDRIRWADSLERVGQYDRAAEVLAELPADQAPFALAKIEFHRGEVESAFAALESLDDPRARAQLIDWLIWDDQLDRAEVHLNLLPNDSTRQLLRVRWHLARQQVNPAASIAQRIQPDAERAWAQALIAQASADAKGLKTQFDTLATVDAHRANWIGAQLNLLGGHMQAALESARNIPVNSQMALYRAQLIERLEPQSISALSAGQQRLFGWAREQVRHDLAQQRYAQAADRAALYLQTRDDDPRMAQYLAQSYQGLGYQQAALDAYLQADLSQTSAQQAAELAEQLSEYPSVIQLLSPYAAALNGPNLNRLLNAWVETGEYQTAERWIRDAVVKSPNNATLYVRWGQLLEGSGDLTGALSKYRQATQLDPQSPEARLYLAAALSSRGEIDRAVGEAEQAIQQPLTAESAILAADVFELAGLNGRAATVLERLPEQQQSQELKLRLARLQVAEGLNHSADQTFASVMNEQIDDAGLWRSWGDALAALGQTNEALEKYKTAVRLNRQSTQN